MNAAAIAVILSFAIGLGGSGSILDRIAEAVGGTVGTKAAKALPTPPASVRVTLKGGAVCDVLPKLGYPVRLPEMTIQTIDGKTLRVILDTNDTVKACKK